MPPTPPTASPPADASDDRVLVLNPVSGDSNHAPEVRGWSTDLGYEVRETEGEGDALDLAREAVADGASVVAAAGGDGTVNEVIRGVVAADGLEQVTVGVVPCGTGNDFAGNIGLTGIEHAFEVLSDGDRRRIDLGFAGDRPFANSCISGLTAEASAQTDPEQKSRFGTAAYVLTTLRTLQSFDGIRVSVTLFEDDGRSPVWSGNAVALLVGNGRRFPPGGSTQANMEDGLLDVTVVRDTDPTSLLTDIASEAVFERETAHTTRYKVPRLDIEVQEADPIVFSLDGEIVCRRQLSLYARPRTLSIFVGEDYDSDPEQG